MCTGFLWPTTGASHRLFRTEWWIFGNNKRLRISWLVEWLLVSQGLFSTQIKSWATWTQFASLGLIYLKSILILSFLLRLCLPSTLLPSVSRLKFSIHSAWPTYRILLDLITLIIRAVISYQLSPNNLLSILLDERSGWVLNTPASY
jgi:hypothetical protein